MQIRTLTLIALAIASSRATAIDYVVTRNDDPAIAAVQLQRCLPSGGCSLRQAILAANKRPGADRILLARDTYTLTQGTMSSTVDGKTGPLWVTEDLSILGSSKASTRIRWSAGIGHLPNNHQVFINDVGAPLRLDTLTVADGRGRYGGCIHSYGDLTINEVIIENCRAERGGAAEIASIVMSMRNSTLRNNQATGNGGALNIGGATTIVADGAQLIDNTAGGDGGAIFGSGVFGYTPSAPAVWRNEGASSLISGNSASGNGGAVSVSYYFSMNFFVYPAGGPRIVFEGNSAGARGGAFNVDPGSYPPSWNKLTLENSLLTDNDAASGGAIASRGNLLINDSEFKQNAANAATTNNGRGGALLLDFGTSSLHGNTEIRQSSFHHNSARGNGGAIASDCQPLSLRDVSMASNATYVGQGSAIAASGATTLTHVTTNGHNIPGSTPQNTLVKLYNTACGAQPFTLANSLIAGADNCYAISAGAFSSNGGNQYGTQAGGCMILQFLDQYQADASVFGLSAGSFGGAKEILGWNNDGAARPQVGFGVSAYCSTNDVRGLPRNDGSCDSGAFEQQP